MIKFLLLVAAVSSSLASGISYRTEDIDIFTIAHILMVNPKYFNMKPVRARKINGISRETVLSMARAHGAIAGVNGGFWKRDGTPAGILKILNTWHGFAVKPRGSIGWNGAENKPIFDQLLMGDTEGEVLPISDPAYTAKDAWKQLDYIVGGTPLLVRNGKTIKDFSLEKTLRKFIRGKYSRTAVGLTKKGLWVFVVIDGRFYGLLGGMNIKTLAKYMLDLGCVEALNLDGGSSSTFVYENLVLNSPDGDISEEGKSVQVVSDAILILPKL